MFRFGTMTTYSDLYKYFILRVSPLDVRYSAREKAHFSRNVVFGANEGFSEFERKQQFSIFE